jgi:hypothetical protein
MQMRDEAKYRRLSEPKESAEKANDDINAFFKEFGELREKYGLPDVLCVVAVNVNYGAGQEGRALTWANLGDSMRVEGLAAYAYGQAQAQHREFMNLLLKGKKHD